MDEELRRDIAAGRNVRVAPLARASGIATATLYIAIRCKEVRAVRIGSAIRVPAVEARRLLGLDDPRAA